MKKPSSNELDFYARQVLMSAYLYYHMNEQVLSDAENDKLCQTLFENWQDVPERYKPLLDPDDTEGLSITMTTYHCKHTLQVIWGAVAWLKRATGKQIKPVTNKAVSGEWLSEKIFENIFKKELTL